MQVARTAAKADADERLAERKEVAWLSYNIYLNRQLKKGQRHMEWHRWLKMMNIPTEREAIDSRQRESDIAKARRTRDNVIQMFSRKGRR